MRKFVYRVRFFDLINGQNTRLFADGLMVEARAGQPPRAKAKQILSIGCLEV